MPVFQYKINLFILRSQFMLHRKKKLCSLFNSMVLVSPIPMQQYSLLTTTSKLHAAMFPAASENVWGSSKELRAWGMTLDNVDRSRVVGGSWFSPECLGWSSASWCADYDTYPASANWCSDVSWITAYIGGEKYNMVLKCHSLSFACLKNWS